MAFALNLPKLSLSGVGAVVDAVEVLSEQPVKKAMIVTDNNLIELGILNSLYQALAEKDVPEENDIKAAQANENELYQQLVEIFSPSVPDLTAESIENILNGFFNDPNLDLESVTDEQITSYLLENLEKLPTP